MVKLLLISTLILTVSAFGQATFESKLPQLTAQLKTLKHEDDLKFEDQFNKLIKELEQTLEREKSICMGELGTDSGEVISKAERQVCLRKIKTHYLASLDEVHNLRKRYLTIIHQRQLKELDETYQTIKAQFDKNF